MDLVKKASICVVGLTLRNCLPLTHTHDWLGWASGASRQSSGIIDLASKVSVPRASLRALEESESYISASIEAMAVVRCVAKRRDYGKESLGSYTRDDYPAIPPSHAYSRSCYTLSGINSRPMGPSGTPLMIGLLC